MTPRLVIIFAFAFACMVIVSGAIIGGRKHAQATHNASVPAASDAADTASTQSDTTPQTPAQQDAAPPESPRPEATQATEPPDSSKQDAAPQMSPPQVSAKQDAAPLEAPHQEAAERYSADPLPIIFTYEQKKQRDAMRVIARDPKAFWIRQIVARIEEKKIDLPTPLDQPVTVQIEFVVGRDGALLSKTVSKSSGSEEADKTAIGMLERAQPFPPMPEGLQDQQLTFVLPVRFH